MLLLLFVCCALTVFTKDLEVDDQVVVTKDATVEVEVKKAEARKVRSEFFCVYIYLTRQPGIILGHVQVGT